MVFTQFDAARLNKCKSKQNKTCFWCLWDDYFGCSSIRTALESYSTHPDKHGKSGLTVRILVMSRMGQKEGV